MKCKGVPCILPSYLTRHSPKGAIQNGQVRYGNKMPSPHYEGMMTRWMCTDCALTGHSTPDRITDLAGWDRMGYDCNVEIRQATNQQYSAKEEKALEKAMVSREATQDVLCEHYSVDEMVATLALNGAPPSPACPLLISTLIGGVSAMKLGIMKNSIDMALMLADMMLDGVCENCPTCENAGLCFCAGRVTCWASMGGSTKCLHKAKPSDVKRFNCLFPRSAADSEWMQEWMGGVVAHHVHPAGEATKAVKEEVKEEEPTPMENPTTMEVEVEGPAGFNATVIRGLRKKDLEILLGKRRLETKGKVAELAETLLEAVGTDAALPENLESWKAAELALEAYIRVGIPPCGKQKKALLAALQGPPAEAPAEAAEPKGKRGAKRKKATDEASYPNQVNGESKKGGGPVVKQKKPKPLRVPPQKGSPILSTHDAFFVRLGARGTVVVDDNGVDVYNAMFVQVDMGTQLNRFYLVQLILTGPPST
jgi:hypothetical protein